MCNTNLKCAIILSGRKGYEIAHKLHWHPTKVSQIVIGAYHPSAYEKRQLADILGKSVLELFSSNQETTHA